MKECPGLGCGEVVARRWSFPEDSQTQPLYPISNEPPVSGHPPRLVTIVTSEAIVLVAGYPSIVCHHRVPTLPKTRRRYHREVSGDYFHAALVTTITAGVLPCLGNASSTTDQSTGASVPRASKCGWSTAIPTQSDPRPPSSSVFHNTIGSTRFNRFPCFFKGRIGDDYARPEPGSRSRRIPQQTRAPSASTLGPRVEAPARDFPRSS